MQQRFLLQILLFAYHVSDTTMPIIRSSRVLYSGCCLCCLVLWFSSCWSGVELRVMCPVCRMLQHPANRTHNPQLHTYTRSRNQREHFIIGMIYVSPTCKDNCHWMAVGKEITVNRAESSNVENVYMLCVRLCFFIYYLQILNLNP